MGVGTETREKQREKLKRGMESGGGREGGWPRPGLTQSCSLIPDVARGEGGWSWLCSRLPCDRGLLTPSL